MPSVLDVINQVFQALFFGTGSWLGLLLFLALCVGLQVAWRYLGVLIFPIMLLFGLEYVDNDLGWHALIIFTGSLFILWLTVKEFKIKRG